MSTHIPSGVAEFLATMADERAEAVLKMRQAILDNIEGIVEERASAKGIDYVIPHSVFPAGYHCNPSQPLGYAFIMVGKAAISFHFFAMYGDEDTLAWVKEEFAKAGIKLDMGAACLKFKKPSEIPLEIIGKLVARVPATKFIERYSAILDTRRKK